MPPGAKKKDLQRFRPDSEVIDRFYDRNVRFWDALREAVPELARLFMLEPANDPVGQLGLRRMDGGHVLFRPAGQKAFSRATQTLIARGAVIEEAVNELVRVPMVLAEPPWRDTMWDPAARKMKTSGYRLHSNLFLHMIDQAVDSPKYDLRYEFGRAIGDVHAELPANVLQR
jgi:hypothetical protein